MRLAKEILNVVDIQDLIDEVLVEKMKRDKKSLEEDLCRGFGFIFDPDPKEDAKQIKKVIKAFERVLEYYEVPE